MRLLFKDLILFSKIILGWLLVLLTCIGYKFDSLYEAFKFFPLHLVVTVGYYAIGTVCYKILLIKDCEKEYDELCQDLKEGKGFFTKGRIKIY